MRFNPPPNWPPVPAGWEPAPGWQPDPEWPPVPQDWPLWIDDHLSHPASSPRSRLRAVSIVAVVVVVMAAAVAWFAVRATSPDTGDHPAVRGTMTLTGTVPVELNPTSLALSRDGSLLLVANNTAATLSVIDPARLQSLRTVAVPGDYQSDVVFDDSSGLAYLPSYGGSHVSVVDPRRGAVVDRISVGAKPGALALSADGKLLFVLETVDDRVAIIDLSTRRILDRIAISGSPDTLAQSPDGRTLYVQTWESASTIAIIDVPTRRVTRSLPAGPNASAIAITPRGDELLVANVYQNTVSIIDPDDGRMITPIPVPKGPIHIAVSPDGGTAYVSTQGDALISIDIAARRIAGTLAVDGAPSGLQVSPDGRTLYVTRSTDKSVAVVSLT
ncbi:hypothetical protein [Tsukamurella sp. NPDC003166]|uniref:hypothetical protein n=1 Tax=Tsukamurella sp. NPDC003166 TaxID=3154444 RepID=UPI0033B7E0AF